MIKSIIRLIDIIKKRKKYLYWKNKLKNRGTDKSLPFPKEKEKKK